jgi:hypothetical protein
VTPAAQPPQDLFSMPPASETDEPTGPEEQERGQSEITFGEDNVDLPEELQNALLRLTQDFNGKELYQRRLEVMRARRNRFYERGIQHIYEDIRTGAFVQGSPGSWVPDQDGGSIQCSQYIADYNIFQRALQIIIAKLTENPPGIDFQPDSGNRAVDLQAAQAAEAYRLLYDRRNSIKDLLTKIVRMFGLDGRTITWTRTEEDPQEWGFDAQGKPLKVQTTEVYGVLEAKVPILAKTMKMWTYCILTDDIPVLQAKFNHPLFRDKISEQGDEGLADTQFERLARLGVLQGNSATFQITDTFSDFVERKNVFLRPAAFEDCSLDSEFDTAEHDFWDEQDDPDEHTLRGALRKIFPAGCRVQFIGSQYVGSWNEGMDDHLCVDFPYAGDGMARLAIMDPGVTIQDRFNDDNNAYAEVKDFGWPSTWVNGEKSTVDAINDQTASPYCFRPFKARTADKALETDFYREPDPGIPDSFMKHTEWMVTYLLQFILAIPSAVQGAGMPDQKTASGYQNALIQAMGQLGVIWGAVQRLMARVYTQAAQAAAREDREGGVLIIPGPKGNVTLKMGDLSKGHFLAHPDEDSGFPESTMQKRSTLDAVMEKAAQSPMGQQLFQSPDNWDFMARTYGLSELTIPEAMVRRKQLAEIELLVQQSPIQPTPEELQQAQMAWQQSAEQAQLAGLPAPPPPDPQSMVKSSVPVAELEYHEWEFELCREKLSDWPYVQQQLANGNEAGIENIRLHAMEHLAFMEQAAARQAQAMLSGGQPQPGQPAGASPVPTAPVAPGA